VNLPGFVALAGLWLQAPAEPPVPVSADLDGDGSFETAVAAVRGRRVRLEVRDTRGQRAASAAVPAPRSKNLSARIQSGALGSAGALLEVAARAGGDECRSVWRFREGELHRLPLTAAGAELPACGPAEEWASGWERRNEDAPASYVRERTRETGRGPHRQIQVFTFTGFRLDLDPVLSENQINGVAIPDWFDGVLYHRQALQALSGRFDLAPLRTLPRLSIEADGPRGVFALRLRDGEGEVQAPVVGRKKGKEKNRVTLQAATAASLAEVSLELANGDVPVEARVQGFGERFDHLYVPVSRLREGALRVYRSAEEELASESLEGIWATERGEEVEVSALDGPGGQVRFGGRQAALSFAEAPRGADVLLVPADGSAPSWALDLLGPHVLARVPVRCETGESGRARCEGIGPGERLRRIGARLNVR